LVFYSYVYRFSLESDLIPGLATFFACLVLPLEIGVLIGIGLNLVSILYHAARPKLLIEVHKVRNEKFKRGLIFHMKKIRDYRHGTA